MLFFFEMFLFVLVMLTLALGEFVSRWLALVLWLVVTAFTLVGYLLARQSLRGIIAGGATADSVTTSGVLAGGSVAEGTGEPPTPASAEPASHGTDAAAPAAPAANAPVANAPVANAPVAEAPDAHAQNAHTQSPERLSPEGHAAAPREVTPLDAKWARTLLYNWRRTNTLLLLGAVVVGGWYWLAS